MEPTSAAASAPTYLALSGNARLSKMIACRNDHLSKNTRRAYRSCINMLEKWVKETYKTNHKRFFINETGHLNPRTYRLLPFRAFSTAHSAEKAKSKRPQILERYRIALAALYIDAGFCIPNDLKPGKQNTLFVGIKNTQTTVDLANGRSLTTGKISLSFSAYAEQCWTTLLRSDDGGFAHLFLTTQWNVMGCAMDAASLHTGVLETACSCV